MNKVNAEQIREAARLMSDQHGPEHERHEMWSAMASLMFMAGDHASGRGNPCSSCVDQAGVVARAYLRAAVRAEPSETTRDRVSPEENDMSTTAETVTSLRRALADATARLAAVWDEGHRLTAPHSDRHCEPICPNPYRAAVRADPAEATTRD